MRYWNGPIGLLTALTILLLGSSAFAGHPTTNLSPGSLPNWHEFSGWGGGEHDSSQHGATETGPCRGWVSGEPNHVFTFTGEFSQLIMRVSSNADTTLLVEGPRGTLCNDDSFGLDPSIGGTWPAGTYTVYVGSFDYGATPQYTLSLLELPPTMTHHHDSGSSTPPGHVPGHVIVPPPIVLPDPPHFAIPATEYYFQGSFEDTEVFFTGFSHQEVHQECLNFTAAVTLSMVDDITAFGQSFRNGPSYWDESTLCAAAALNARPSNTTCPVVYSGNVEGLPFSINAMNPDELRNLIRTYGPTFASAASIDDVQIEGQNHHNGPSYWNNNEVTNMLLSNFVDEMAPIVAQGSIEDLPFAFSGYSVSEIRTQCETFWNSAQPSLVDDIVVNGQAQHNGPSYWNQAEACMLISSMSVR